MRLNGIVFPRALADESADSMFVDIKSFTDATEGLVIPWPNQALNVGGRDTPRVCCSWPGEPFETRRERVPEGRKKPSDVDFRCVASVGNSIHTAGRSHREIASRFNRRSTVNRFTESCNSVFGRDQVTGSVEFLDRLVDGRYSAPYSDSDGRNRI
jgi:hypothetical protein